MNRSGEDMLRSVLSQAAGRKGRFGVEDHLVVDTEIPGRHPARQAIEQCVRALLLGVPGDWRLSIRRTRVRHDWIVRVEGPRCRWVGAAKECDAQESARTLVQGFLPVLHGARVFS